MPILYNDHSADLTGMVSVEDAEVFLGWLQMHPQAKLNLSECTHLHAANLQVLMATTAHIEYWPHDEELAAWLKNTLEPSISSE